MIVSHQHDLEGRECLIGDLRANADERIVSDSTNADQCFLRPHRRAEVELDGRDDSRENPRLRHLRFSR